MTNVASYEMHPTVANAIVKASESKGNVNRTLLEKLDANEGNGVKLAKIIHLFNSQSPFIGQQNAQETTIVPVLLSMIEEANSGFASEIWNIIRDNSNKSEKVMKSFFFGIYMNKNPMILLASKIPSAIPSIIKSFIEIPNYKSMMDLPHIENLIYMAMRNPEARDYLISHADKEFLAKIRMTPQTRKLQETKLTTPIQTPETSENNLVQEMFGSTSVNWYKCAKIYARIQRRAGKIEPAMLTLITAIVMVMMGSGIHNTARRMKIREEELQKAIQNKTLVEQAIQIQQQYEIVPEGEMSNEEQTQYEQWQNWQRVKNTQQNIKSKPPQKPNVSDSSYEVLKSRVNAIGGTNDFQILDEVANQYKLTGDAKKLLFIIRIIENGREGLEMGVGDGISNHPARRHAGDHEKSLRLQAEWASGTITRRFNGDLENFAKRYCSVNWENWKNMASKFLSLS
jgi:transposase-like protein